MLFVVAIGLSLGQEYGLLIVHPELFKWIGGLLAVIIVVIFLMVMMFD